jgi:methylglyoxal synthase
MKWAKFNRPLLAHHRIYATGATAALLEQELGFEITELQNGPLGGYQQIGAKVDAVIFFSDPLKPLSHDLDVKALLRMAVAWNVPIACNRGSADFMISPPLRDGEFSAVYPLHLTKRLS